MGTFAGPSWLCPPSPRGAAGPGSGSGSGSPPPHLQAQEGGSRAVALQGCGPFAQSCLIFYNPMDCSPPGCSVHGILQARIYPQVPAAARRPLASLSLQGHSPLQTSQPACTAFLASAPPRNPSLCSFLGSSKTSSSFLHQGLCKSCSYFVLLHRHQHTHRLAPSCPPEAHPRHHLPGEAFSRPPDKRPLVTLEPFLLQHSAGSLSVSKFLSIVYRIFSTKVKSLLCCSSQLPKLPGQRLKHGSGSAHIC